MLDSVFITGGSRGIGEAAVRKFAAMGKRVAFTYLNSEKKALVLSRETGAFAFRADVTNHIELKSVIAAAKETIGSIDILVNNAGISQIKLLLDISIEEWELMIKTNLSSMYTATRAILPDMLTKNAGRIINISSIWGKRGASCETHYSASKAAVTGFTTALSDELKSTGITVNCIAPGVIATDMNSGFSESELEDIKAHIPMRRLGTADEVAALIYFLASPEAQAVNRQIITIDGGITL